MKNRFEQFIKERRFLDNLSENTLKYYGYVFNRWNEYVNAEPTTENIKTFVIKIRESGVSEFTANSYIRGMNAYLKWCGTDFKIKKVREPSKLLVVFTDKQLKSLISHKGTTFAEKRMHALVCLLIDTGCRIDEALRLKKNDVDYDNLLVKVRGKGNKERLIPISPECRKVLYRFGKHKFNYFFPARGASWAYRSALDQFKRLCKRLGIEGPRCSFHTIRHYYAINYIRNGGDIYRLSKILGHADIQTTTVYLKHMGIEPIREAHQLYSPLSRL